MPTILRRHGYAPAVLALFLAALLACEVPQLLPKPTAVPTRAEPPTTVVQQATVAATSAVQSPTATATATATTAIIVVPTKPIIAYSDSSAPAQDPCSLPGIQFRANFHGAGTNALTAPFTGDVTILKTAGGPNIFSFQEASVQRKFVILLPNLNPAVYDLKATYMSYTEKTGANDKNPRVWKAASGFLQVELCAEGGMALRTVTGSSAFAGMSAVFQPLPAGHNTATGDMDIGVGAKIQ